MKYKLRVKRHQFNEKIVGFIIKRMALRLLRISNLHKKSDGTYSSLEITYYPNGYDSYTYCKSPNKKYCGKKGYHFVGYIEGYSFYGNTLSEMYCDIISRLLFSAPLFPFCTGRILVPRMKVNYKKHTMIRTTSAIVPTDKNFNIILK